MSKLLTSFKSSKTQLRQQFCELTGTSNTTATKYLESVRYDLARAIDNYYNKHPNKAQVTKEPVKVKIDDRLIQIFDKYKDNEDPNKIDIEGTLTYLGDLGISPDQIESLSLALLLKSPKTGVFTRENFLHIWQYYQCFDIGAMSEFITRFNKDLMNNIGGFKDISTVSDDENKLVPLKFQDLYNFTFKFSLETESQKFLDLDTAIEYWKLLLPIITETYSKDNKLDEEFKNHVNERVEQWFKFLTDNEYMTKKSISYDSWSMFYLFFKEIVLIDPIKFKDYDEMAAWPSVVDEFLEYLHDFELL